MTKNISIAKIAAPVPGHILERERLYSLLDKRPSISWISSPGGSGKTTLVASYLRSRNIPHIWYRLDDGDGDIATFFHYLGLAAKKAAPRRKTPLPHLTPEFMMGIPTFSKRFFEELYSRLKPPAVIVFDDYHEVSAQSGFHDIVNSGLSVLPDGISVIIMSRVNPPEIFSRLQVNRMMAVIGWKTLRLDIEETAGIGHLINPSAIESHIPEVLHQKTGGWMAGLILMLESAHMEKLSAISINDDISEVIFGYFETEIFYSLDEEIRLFLLKTAFMPGMTSEMAKKITGLKQARRILSDLYGRNCFVEKRLQNPPVYQYHPLFRAFLLKEADEYFSEEEKAGLLKSTASLLAQSGQVEEAAELLMETGDLEQFIPLILENAQPFVVQGRNRIVETWIQAIPEPLLEENPWLIFWLGSCKMAYNMIEARSYFKKSFHILDSQNNAEGTFLSWYGVAESILWGWDDYNSFDEWINVLNGIIKKYNSIPEGEIKTRVSTAMFSAITMHCPDHPQFELWKERALSTQIGNPDLSRQMTVLVYFFLYLYMCGRLDEGDEIYLSIKRLVSSNNPSSLEIMQAKLSDAMQANYRGNHEHCLEVVDKSLAISRRSGVHVIDGMIAGQALWSSLKNQDFEKIDHYARIIESLLSFLSPFERAFYHFLKAYIALYKKNLPLAEKESGLSLQIVLNIGVIPPLLSVYSLRAYTLYELGRDNEVSEILSEAFNVSLRFDKEGYTFEFLLLEAYFAFQGGDEEAGFKALKAGLAQGKDRGYKVPLFFSLPEINSDLYVKALSAGIEVDYVQQLIRNNNLLPPEDMKEIEYWPWPIKIYTLGSFRIEVDGKPLQEGRKSHHRLFNLLNALICLGGTNVPSYRLADILWPDQDGDAAQSALDMGIHRLRKLLNCAGAIEVKHGSVSLNRNICWIDAIAFDEQVCQLKGKGKEKKSYSTADMENVLSLYKGKLLPSLEDVEWTMPMRESLRNHYLNMLERLGRTLEESKKWEDALECYSRGVENNPLSEEHVRGLMRTCKVLDRPVKAMRAYQKFEENLKNNMGIDPSSATKALLKEIS